MFGRCYFSGLNFREEKPTIQKWPEIWYVNTYVHWIGSWNSHWLYNLKLWSHEINQLMGKISWEICDSFGSILGQRPNHKWFLKSSTSFARAGKSSDVDHADIWWVNYNISLTWIKAIWGSFPLLTMVRSQWGRYNLPRYMMGKYYPSLSSKPWDGMGLFSTMRKTPVEGQTMWWFFKDTFANQRNDGFGDLASLLKSMKVDWVHERNHRCPFPAGWFHGKVPYYWRILVLKKW